MCVWWEEPALIIQYQYALLNAPQETPYRRCLFCSTVREAVHHGGRDLAVVVDFTYRGSSERLLADILVD